MRTLRSPDDVNWPVYFCVDLPVHMSSDFPKGHIVTTSVVCSRKQNFGSKTRKAEKGGETRPLRNPMYQVAVMRRCARAWAGFKHCGAN